MNKRAEFVRLFLKFVNSYLYTPAGLRHTAAYEEQRKQARRNFEAIRGTAESGEDMTEPVLLQLLPYIDSANNRHKGAWIHHSGCTKFEQKVWTKSEDSSLIAKAVFRFVCHCNDDPQQLSIACSEFWELPYCKEFQMGMLTPILNALHPDDFLLINNKSRQVINYFANTSYSQKLTDYPTINTSGHKLIEELAEDLHQPGVPALRDDDLFDMFCHWLVAVKKYGFATQELSIKELISTLKN